LTLAAQAVPKEKFAIVLPHMLACWSGQSWLKSCSKIQLPPSARWLPKNIIAGHNYLKRRTMTLWYHNDSPARSPQNWSSQLDTSNQISIRYIPTLRLIILDLPV
jgi:hypothetical protein